MESIPGELQEALDGDPKAHALFMAMSASHRREYAKWVGEAKRESVRRARSEKAVKMIVEKARGAERSGA